MARQRNQPRPALLRASTSTGGSLSRRQQLAFIVYAWMFGSVWLWAISGAAMTRFSREMGVPDYGFGLIAALPFLGTLLQVPMSYVLERYGRRKLIFLWFAGIGRAMWTVTAMIPWVLPGARAWWWPVMLLSLLCSWLLMQASGPAWMNWMSDVVPRQIRGRYFGVRNQVGQGFGLLTTVGIGFALDQTTAIQDTHPDIVIQVTSAILGVAGLMGVMDILCFRFVDDAPAEPPKPVTESMLQMMLRPLKEKEFRRYLMFNFMMTLGIGCIGQYIWLYVFDVVGWSDLRANLLLIAVPLLVRVCSFSIWGKLIDRLGKKPVILIVGCVSVVDTIGWLLVGPGRLWPGYLFVLVSVFAWPGMEVANFNFILNLSGGGRGRDRAGGTSYVAVNSVAIAVGGVCSGLLGAVISDKLGGWQGTLPVLDIPLTYHSVLLLIAAGLKLLAMVWVLGLHEPKAVGTRDAIRFMTSTMYSNVRQAALMPTRVVGRAVKWSYKIGPAPRRR